MKRLAISLGFCVFNTPLFASEANINMPDWIMSPPSGTASACSIIKNDEQVAQRVAMAKARAELGRMRKANVQSVQEIEKEVKNGQSSKSIFVETTRVTSEESLDTTEIMAQSQVDIDGHPNLCVLVGFGRKNK